MAARRRYRADVAREDIHHHLGHFRGQIKSTNLAGSGLNIYGFCVSEIFAIRQFPVDMTEPSGLDIENWRLALYARSINAGRSSHA